MAKIKIVTDSTADIPLSVREEYGIKVIPLKVHFGEETFLDSVTMNADEFYRRLIQAEALPTTSQPSPVEFLEVYKRLIDADPEVQIISIHISSALSGTYQSAVLAKSLLEEKQANISIVDSKSASYGLGMLAVAAAKSANSGKALDAVIDEIHTLRNETRLYFLVDTLEYLQKGGRIGKAASVLGSLLNIKPILSIDPSGEVYSVDKVRGQKKALARIIELLKADFPSDTKLNLALAYTDTSSYAEQVAEIMQEQFQIEVLSYTSIGPVVGTHVGPGTVGLFARPV